MHTGAAKGKGISEQDLTKMSAVDGGGIAQTENEVEEKTFIQGCGTGEWQ